MREATSRRATGSPRWARPSAAGSAWRSFQINAEFRVPLWFAYRWCTDYGPDDPKYSGEDRLIHLQRRVIERSRKKVVFENLYDEGKGWAWERHVVTLHPPDHWHCEGRGNHSESVLDYRLTALSPDRTRLEMRWRSRPRQQTREPRPPAGVVETFVAGLWRRRGRALEQEYRRLRDRSVRPTSRDSRS